MDFLFLFLSIVDCGLEGRVALILVLIMPRHTTYDILYTWACTLQHRLLNIFRYASKFYYGLLKCIIQEKIKTLVDCG